MTEAAALPVPNAASTAAGLDALRHAGAPTFDAVGWHYIEVLAAKTQTHTGTTQTLLQGKLDKALGDLSARMAAAKSQHQAPSATTTARLSSSSAPSPLAQLLQALSPLAQPTPSASAASKPSHWRAESPRVQQFRKTLSKLSVQKQVTQAIAQAPQNAGPINSHMLVLRSLGLMRELSPDYLNRFIAYVDTLLCLDEAGKAKPVTRKPTLTSKSKK